MPGAARRRAQVLLPRRRVASSAEFSHRTGFTFYIFDFLATDSHVQHDPATEGRDSTFLSGDLVVPGDYDGDRRTDLAVCRPSTGKWVKQSEYKLRGIRRSAVGTAGRYPDPEASLDSLSHLYVNRLI